MLKPGHPIANAAYAIAQQINPNNHALDGGPATAHMEREVIAQMAAMVGFDPAIESWTSHIQRHDRESGSALDFAPTSPGQSDRVFGGSALHPRPHVRGARRAGIAIATDQAGRLDLEDLRSKAMEIGIGTVVATAGTTGIGTVDPIDDLVALGQELGFRIHVDAAYGGYYTLLAGLPADHPAALDPKLPPHSARSRRAIRS
ncbi:MAG: pyridoxal-dependent decarboxylase [Thermomicrobiales bacterium]